MVWCLTLFSLIGLVVSVPFSYKGCNNNISLALPYCDVSLSITERVNDLMNRLTLEERIACISPQESLGDTCNDHTAGVDSVGLPPYMWLTETNSGIF